MVYLSTYIQYTAGYNLKYISVCVCVCHTYIYIYDACACVGYIWLSAGSRGKAGHMYISPVPATPSNHGAKVQHHQANIHIGAGRVEPKRKWQPPRHWRTEAGGKDHQGACLESIVVGVSLMI